MASSADNNDDGYERVEQPGDVEELVERAVWFVDDGHGTVDGLDLPEWVDSIDESEFHDRVRDGLDCDDQDDSGRDGVQSAADRTSDPLEINWVAMWEGVNLDPGDDLSRTQLALLIGLSDQTSVGRANAGGLIEDAVEAGQLSEIDLGTYENGGRAVNYAPSLGRVDG